MIFPMPEAQVNTKGLPLVKASSRKVLKENSKKIGTGSLGYRPKVAGMTGTHTNLLESVLKFCLDGLASNIITFKGLFQTKG